MEKNNIQNNNVDMNQNTNKENNKNNPTPIESSKTENKKDNKIILPNKNEAETQGNLTKNKKIKYRINFSVIINELRNNSGIKEIRSDIEYKTNVLLMLSEIDQINNESNKISCLTLISYINHEKNNSLYIYYLNKKIFKYLQVQKGIESFIYIRTLYRAAYFLEKDKNYFYAYKYIEEAKSLSKNSRIDAKSKNMLIDLRNNIIDRINEYKTKYIKLFRDIENEKHLNEQNYQKLKSLIKDLIDNKYQIEKDENGDEYLYLINKKWVEKAYNFLKDYIDIRENNKKGNYFNKAFDPEYTCNSYFDNDDNNIKKDLNKYNPFPCLIDNYSISNWKDNWNDPLNEDENNYLKKDLVYMKDYYLLKKSDFEFLEYFFGATNIIKRKKNCLDFIQIKCIIFDKRLKEKENTFLLRNRSFQLRKNSTILDFKEKLIRCVEFAIKENLENLRKQNNKNKNNKTSGNKNVIMNSEFNKNNNESGIVTKTNLFVNETKENENKDVINDNANNNEKKGIKYNIYFYFLKKEKKGVLFEACISFVNNIPIYDSLYINNIDIQDNDNIEKLSSFNKKENILMIEIQHNNDPLFLNEINKNKLSCVECQKEISSLDNIYKCNYCYFSLFCCEKCANKNENHKILDKIYSIEYLVEEFDLDVFLKKNIKNLLKPEEAKGMVGLSNLGNTCYMNSSLQCLSNSLDLTKYFLLKYYLNDINRGNRLGSNGSVATEYYKLINDMWCGNDTRIAPSEFIKSFQKFKSQFSTFRQQDAQEFLSLLLEQLHEDLNRISNKPYVELSEKQPNEDDIVASKRWWDLHKKREDSIIIDLFNGQFKSEITCQVCKKSSITYDPFMFLCLPLPKIKSNYSFKIFCGLEFRTFEFEYFEKSRIIDLKNKAVEFIILQKKININSLEQLKLLNIETVLLDENKNFKLIIETDVNKKNYKGDIELRDILARKWEIIFFENNAKEKDKEYIDIFVYPIEKQKPIMSGYTKITKIEYFSYPLYYKLKNETTVKELFKIIYNRLDSLNLYNKEKAWDYANKNLEIKVIDLNIIHGEETKKTGFTSWFSMEQTCKYCNESNDTNFYCSISNFTQPNKTIFEVFKNLQKPIVLLATSECYNLKGERMVYIESSSKGNNNSPGNKNKFNNSILLKDALDLFGKENNLQDDNMWYCSKCQKHQISNQKLQIYRAPNYLIIQLKRFNVKKNYEGSSSFSGEKNNTFVEYPVNDFDLSEYIVGLDKTNSKYDLYGVIKHSGSLNGGHYTAICKNQGNWVNYNDSSISIENDPVTRNAYILFYVSKRLSNAYNEGMEIQNSKDEKNPDTNNNNEKLVNNDNEKN